MQRWEQESSLPALHAYVIWYRPKDTTTKKSCNYKMQAAEDLPPAGEAILSTFHLNNVNWKYFLAEGEGDPTFRFYFVRARKLEHVLPTYTKNKKVIDKEIKQTYNHAKITSRWHIPLLHKNFVIFEQWKAPWCSEHCLKCCQILCPRHFCFHGCRKYAHVELIQHEETNRTNRTYKNPNWWKKLFIFAKRM